MSSTTVVDNEFLYEEVINFTQITEYGVGLDKILDAQYTIPPEGVRIDVAFEGTIQGDKLRGKIEGVDYLRIDPEGKFHLFLRGKITTEENEAIAFDAEGIAIPNPETAVAQVTQNVKLTTASSIYSWVNKLEIFVQGKANLNLGQVHLKGYSV